MWAGLLVGGNLSDYSRKQCIRISEDFSDDSNQSEFLNFWISSFFTSFVEQMEGPAVHIASSSVSAVSAVMASAPADVVLNRYQAKLKHLKRPGICKC